MDTSERPPRAENRVRTVEKAELSDHVATAHLFGARSVAESRHVTSQIIANVWRRMGILPPLRRMTRQKLNLIDEGRCDRRLATGREWKCRRRADPK
ncbi:hypothetical protein MTO96_050798 [Rhipicephalus appendiculatus]